MPRVYQPRGPGTTWHADYTDNGRQRPSLRTQVKAEALVKLARLVEAASLHGPRVLAPTRVTWQTWKAEYRTILLGSGAKPEAARRDMAAIVALELYAVPEVLGQLTPHFLIKWAAWMRGEGYAPATINRHLGGVKTMLNRAQALGFVPKQDYSVVKRMKRTKKKPKYWSVEEVGKLFAAADIAGESWPAVARLSVCAGLRGAEIYWLSWADVDFAPGKDEPHGRLYVAAKDSWDPKGYKERPVPLTKRLAAFLKSRKRAGPWVLGERPRFVTLSAYFPRIVRRAGLTGTLHVGRHTFASQALKSGVDLATVSEWLGHSSIETTAIYAHVIRNSDKPSIDRTPDY